MNNKKLFRTLLASLALGAAGHVLAHGDVTPQPVNTDGLDKLGSEWRDQNPYRKPYANNAKAVEIGASAYTQNWRAATVWRPSPAASPRTCASSIRASRATSGSRSG